MNSDPSRVSGTKVDPKARSATIRTAARFCRAAATSGRTSPLSARLSGLRASEGIRPRTNHSISTGTTVTEKSAAPAMAKVLVNASGLKRRPASAWSPKRGRNETVMIRSEKKSDGPTSTAASISTSRRGASSGARSRCLWAFSTMTMPASIMVPMAMAMPPSDMMLALMPW